MSSSALLALTTRSGQMVLRCLNSMSSPSFSIGCLSRGIGHEFLCGFLLGEAVEGAEAPDEVDGVDADDFAVGKQLAMVLRAWRSLGSLKVGTRTRRWRCRSWRSWRGGAGLRRLRARAWGVRRSRRACLAEVAGGAEAVEVFGEGEVVFVVGVGLDGR